MASVFVIDSSFTYARGFFVTSPAASPLIAGETRHYPIKYDDGYPAADAFELLWYPTQSDADAMTNRLTEMDRLPKATFNPEAPKTSRRQILQDSTVTLTAPASNGYVNPVGVVMLTQDTGKYTEPYIYLLEDELLWISNIAYRDYPFRYWIGEPAIVSFYLEWYPTRLAANLRIGELTDEDRLPRAVWTPEMPNTVAAAEELQDGVLRLYSSQSDTLYTELAGLLCMEQQPVLKEIDVEVGQNIQRSVVWSNWKRGR